MIDARPTHKGTATAAEHFGHIQHLLSFKPSGIIYRLQPEGLQVNNDGPQKTLKKIESLELLRTGSLEASRLEISSYELIKSFRNLKLHSFALPSPNMGKLPSPGIVMIQDCEIFNLNISGGANISNPVCVHDSKIAILEINETCGDVNFDQCNIGILRTNKISSRIYFRNCTICRLIVNTVEKIPVGEITLDYVDIARKETTYYSRDNFDPQNVQSDFRPSKEGTSRLREWAENNSDMKTWITARGAELDIEKEREVTYFKYVLAFWKEISDFGRDLFRPLRLIIAMFLLSTCVYIIFGTHVDFEDTSEDSLGWRSSLIGSDVYSHFLRAAFLSLKSTVSPLSAFQYRSIVLPGNSFSALWTILQGFGSFGLLIVFGFALRRRLMWR